MHELINKLVIARVRSRVLRKGDDAAVYALNNLGITKAGPDERVVMSTDSFVVNPLFFPGGDIGKLAVCGTVNDVAMMGGVPRLLAVAGIIEEGLDLAVVDKVLASVIRTAESAGVEIVTGDTKVVERGMADKMFITTTGIGFCNGEINLSGANARVGDVVIVSGNIGEHELAVMNARKKLGFISSNIKSDCACLHNVIRSLLHAVPGVRVLRDPTRGGLATTLNEITGQSRVDIVVYENKIPVSRHVKKAAEILGLDPLYMACEGRFVAIVPPQSAGKALKSIRRHTVGHDAGIVGTVRKRESRVPKVVVNTQNGGERIALMLEGEQLPRIC